MEGDWNVCFSLNENHTYGFPAEYSVSDVELDFEIWKDTSAPIVTVETDLSQPVSGSIPLEVSVKDDAFMVYKVEFYVDEVLVNTYTNPEIESQNDNGLTNPMIYSEDPRWFNATIVWDSFLWANGGHTLSFVAVDSLGKESEQQLVVGSSITIENGLLDNPIQLTGIAGFIIIGLIAGIFYVTRRHSRTNVVSNPYLSGNR